MDSSSPPPKPLPRRRPSSSSVATHSSTRTWKLKTPSYAPAPATVSAISAPAFSSDRPSPPPVTSSPTLPSSAVPPRPLPLSSHSQDAMKRVLERDDHSVAASRAEQAKIKGKGRGLPVLVTSEFGGEGGGEEGMFLPNRRPLGCQSTPSPVQSSGALTPPTESDSATSAQPAEAAVTPPTDPPTDHDPDAGAKKPKLRHPSRKVARPSTWFGWGGGEGGPSSDQAHPDSSSLQPTLHRRESSNPEPAPVGEPPSTATSDLVPALSAVDTSSNCSAVVSPLASAEARPDLSTMTDPSLHDSSALPSDPSSVSKRLVGALASKAYFGKVGAFPSTAAAASLKPGGGDSKEDPPTSITPAPASTLRVLKSRDLDGTARQSSRGSWFRSAPPDVDALVVEPPAIGEVATTSPRPEQSISSLSESAHPAPTGRLSWLSKATSSSTLRPASVARPVDSSTPRDSVSELVQTAEAPLTESATEPTSAPVSQPPSASSSWFRRPASTSSLSSSTSPASRPATQRTAEPPQANASPVSSATSSVVSPVPIPRKASLGSSSSPSPAASSYGSTRPAIPSSLGKEVVTADSSELASEGSGGWWGYVPGIRGGGGLKARKEVVSLVEERDEEAVIPQSPVHPTAPVIPAPAGSAVSTAQPSYLNPIAWVWPSAPPSAAASQDLTTSHPAPATPSSSERAQVDATSKDLVVAAPATGPPTSYASWLSYIASKAIPPPTFAKPATDGGDGMEVMDIDDESPASTKSPVPSIRSGKQSISDSASSTAKSAKNKSTTIAPVNSPVPSSSSPPKPLTSQATTLPSKAVARSASNTTLKGPPPPNLVLPTFDDIFARPPRSTPPPPSQSLARKTLSVLNTYVLPTAIAPPPSTAQETKLEAARRRGTELPKTWSVVGGSSPPTGVRVRRDVSRSARRIVVLGVHGWFPNNIVRYIAGEPTGTSTAFATKMDTAIRRYLAEMGGEAELEKLTVMPLEGEGKVADRVDRLFKEYLSRPEWVDDLRSADAIFVATHSQGCPVSTHLLFRLFEQGHLQSTINQEAVHRLEFAFGPPSARRKDAGVPRVAMLAICGVHVGPLAYLNASSVIMPYLQYFENAAAHELFEFQDTESAVSRAYTASLSKVLDHGVKMVYVASLNDQVVPVYGAIFSPASHPNILRVLHIDGAAFDKADFVTNLLVFCIQLRNAGLSDHGMISHLSEAVASGLTGVGHSTAYSENTSYSLTVKYLFETTPSKAAPGSLEVEEFLATEAKNSYEIPWILRGILEDPLVLELFGHELDTLRNGFEAWQPSTAKMKDLRKKLEPLRPRQSRRAAASQPVTGVVPPTSLPHTAGGTLSPKL